MSVKIHIEGGDRRPIGIRDYLDLIDQYEYRSKDEVIQDAYDRGYELGELDTKNMVSTLSKLGLVEKENKQNLTRLGEQLVEVSIYNPELFFELLHGIYSTAFYRDPSPDRRISWAYYSVSEFLYEEAPVDSFTNRKQDIVDDLIYKSDEKTEISNEERGAFSRKSVNGYEKFIEHLNPAVLQDGKFLLRSRGPVELVLYVIDAIYNSPIIASTVGYGDLLDLSDDVRKFLGVTTLVDPQSIDELLTQTASAYDILNVEADYRVRLRLRDEVSINDLA